MSEHIEIIYRFIGEGRGVPGLAHVMRESDVQRLGVERLMADAIKNGNYEVIKPKTATVIHAVENKPKSAEKKAPQTDEEA